MGIIGDLINGALGVSSQIYERHKDAHLTDAQREANAFSAEQAGINREFEAQQAEIARDWQELQYLQYNSPSALVRQYQEAGINPALMFGGSTPPAADSTAIPAGSAPSSVSPSVGDPFGALAQVAQIATNIEYTKAQTRKTNADSYISELQGRFDREMFDTNLKKGKLDYDNALAGLHLVQEEIKRSQELGSMNTQRIKIGDNEIEASKLLPSLKAAELAVMNSQTSRNQSEGNLLDEKTVYEEWRRAFREQTGLDPDTNQWSLVFQAIRTLSFDVIPNAARGARDLFNKLFNN